MFLKDYKEKYNISSYEEAYQKQCDYLNKIDFKPYIEDYEILDDLWNAIEDDYDDSEISNNYFLEGNIFNHFSHADLVDYIFNKYNVSYTECITYRRT